MSDSTLRGRALSTETTLVLEAAAREVAQATAKPPFLYEIGFEAARNLLEGLQSAPIAMPPVDEGWVEVECPLGDVRVRIVRPAGLEGLLPAVLYMHGGGWVLGSAATHDRLVRELAVGANAAVVFVEYARSPEARYPVAIEQGYATASWIAREGHEAGLDPLRIAVAGDSVGGNMAAVLTLMAKERGDVRFVHQSMYYPVTDAAMDTASYKEFADGPYIRAKTMEWFWDCYTKDVGERAEVNASPNRAGPDQLRGLPPAFVLVNQADVLRDEGEAYAAKLRAADVPITTARFEGTIHDFMMLNLLSDTSSTRSAVAMAVHALRQAFKVA
jgi:acetyl esterase